MVLVCLNIIAPESVGKTSYSTSSNLGNEIMSWVGKEGDNVDRVQDQS